MKCVICQQERHTAKYCRETDTHSNETEETKATNASGYQENNSNLKEKSTTKGTAEREADLISTLNNINSETNK